MASQACHRGLALAVLLSSSGCAAMAEWKGDVEVAPVERVAARACGGTGEPTADGARLFQRQPYLQNTTTNEVTVRFAAPRGETIQVHVTRPDQAKTSEPATPRVEAPTFVGTPQQRRRAERAAESAHESLSPDEYWLVSARITDLEPGTLYCYQLKRGNVALTDPAPLKTAPQPNQEAPSEFVILGDPGTGGAAQKAIAKRLSEVNFEFMMFVGDIAYPSGTPRQVQSYFFSIYAEFLRMVPAYVALGNHEYRTDDAEPVLHALEQPGPERYFDFMWGDVHIVVLDSNRPTRTQARWLEDRLRQSRGKWRLIFAHHPPFSSSVRGPSALFRQRFSRLWARYDVDAVIAGHEHHYERMGPLRGIHYLVSGGAGGRLTRVWSGVHTKVRRAVHHYLHARVDKDQLIIRAIDIDGKTIDEITIDAN